jgi:hypothetical protein
MELQNKQDVVNGDNFDGRGRPEGAQMPKDMDDNLVPRTLNSQGIPHWNSHAACIPLVIGLKLLWFDTMTSCNISWFETMDLYFISLHVFLV